MKNCMFFGNSFLNGFWQDFGKVLGGQNHLFSQFVRHFFDAKFRMQVGRAKNSKKMIHQKPRGLFFMIFCGPCGLGGKDYWIGGSLPKPEFQALP